MSGKNMSDFENLFNEQRKFQEMIEGKETGDDVGKFMYHITSMSEEIGELLKADKRWKTHRNCRYVEEEKLDELADCFITLFNIALWSGYEYHVVQESIERKIEENFDRLNNEHKVQGDK